MVEVEEMEGGRARKAEMREMVYSVTWMRSSRPVVRENECVSIGGWMAVGRVYEN